MLKLLLVLTVTLSDSLSEVQPPSDVMLDSLSNTQPPSDVPSAVTLLPNSEVRCCPKNKTNRELPTVYCYHGTRKSLVNIWQTVSVLVDMTRPEKYDVYEGVDEADVLAKYESSQSKWVYCPFKWGRKTIELNPFNTTCLGIRTVKDYTLTLKVTQVNKILVGMFILGALLFFLAPVLVHNQLFYYAVGITIGVLASVLVLMYFVITLLPLKRPAMIGMMAGGSTVIFYFFQSFINNLMVWMPMYIQLVYGYLIISGFISFIVCYRFGPLTNPRSKNIIQWSLQIVSVLLVLFSSYNNEAVMLLTGLILLLYKFPVTKLMISTVKNNAIKVRTRTPNVPRRPSSSRLNSPPRKLRRKPPYLSKEEFREQGRIETEKALEEFREYCKSSPEKWASIDSKNYEKFTKFISGESHITREELEAKIIEEEMSDEE